MTCLTRCETTAPIGPDVAEDIIITRNLLLWI